MFQKFISRVKKIKPDEVVRKAAEEITDDIERLNREQLVKGKRKDNSAISPRYKSIKYKGRLRPVDLKVTGDYHKSIRAKAEQRALVTGSQHTVKGYALADGLEEKYSGGSSIYGIPNKELKQLLLPLITKELRRAISN